MSSRESERFFEQKAKQIHGYLKTSKRYGDHFLRAPLMIELTGSPSAGKTTCITELDKFFRRYDLRVLKPQEGAEVVRHIPRTTPVYNLRTGLYALMNLVDFSYGHAYDIVLFDRCVFDAYGWMMYWRGKNAIVEHEMRIFQDFFLSRLWAEKLAACFIMVADPTAAMERELRIALTTKLGETTNPETIRVLVERYRTMHAELSGRFPQVEIIDTTRMEEDAMVELVARRAIAAIERKIEKERRKAPASR